jgi:hypothetical protein
VKSRSGGQVQTHILERIVPTPIHPVPPAGPRTPGEAQTQLKAPRPAPISPQGDLFEKVRTLRTPFSYSDPRFPKESFITESPIEYQKGVRSVRKQENTCLEAPQGVPEVAGPLEFSGGGRLPYLTLEGGLVIPFDSPERYHWWKPGGQSVQETLSELGAGQRLTGSSVASVESVAGVF